MEYITLNNNKNKVIEEEGSNSNELYNKETLIQKSEGKNLILNFLKNQI
jgi:hypothetical protein